MHGRIFNTSATYGPIKIAVLYHPCVAIYNPHKKDLLKNDFKILK
jgi:uracil-DNA glycosylase family 4